MRYLIRLNPRAVNPLTRRVFAPRLWEVEQCANKDSERVIWHCADVRVDQKLLTQIAPLEAYQEFGKPIDGKKPWELEVWGVCVRGQDDVIEIRTGDRDASGN